MVDKIKYFLLYCVLYIMFCFDVSALTYGGCDYSNISRLKSIVSNINITYDYSMIENQAYFNITINNIAPGIYFIDSETGIKYNYSNTVDGEITIYNSKNTKGQYKFYSELGECYGVSLGSKYYVLPNYNRFYNDPICKNNQNYIFCKKWTKVKYSRSDIEKFINDYNKKEEPVDEIVYKKGFLSKLVSIYINYYYFILIGIIVICGIVMFVDKKRNRFNV